MEAVEAHPRFIKILNRLARALHNDGDKNGGFSHEIHASVTHGRIPELPRITSNNKCLNI
jgi:hypothetical protein